MTRFELREPRDRACRETTDSEYNLPQNLPFEEKNVTFHHLPTRSSPGGHVVECKLKTWRYIQACCPDKYFLLEPFSNIGAKSAFGNGSAESSPMVWRWGRGGQRNPKYISKYLKYISSKYIWYALFKTDAMDECYINNPHCNLSLPISFFHACLTSSPALNYVQNLQQEATQLLVLCSQQKLFVKSPSRLVYFAGRYAQGVALVMKHLACYKWL